MRVGWGFTSVVEQALQRMFRMAEQLCDFQIVDLHSTHLLASKQVFGAVLNTRSCFKVLRVNRCRKDADMKELLVPNVVVCVAIWRQLNRPSVQIGKPCSDSQISAPTSNSFSIRPMSIIVGSGSHFAQTCKHYMAANAYPLP